MFSSSPVIREHLINMRKIILVAVNDLRVHKAKMARTARGSFIFYLSLEIGLQSAKAQGFLKFRLVFANNLICIVL